MRTLDVFGYWCHIFMSWRVMRSASKVEVESRMLAYSVTQQKPRLMLVSKLICQKLLQLQQCLLDEQTSCVQ